MRRGLPRLVMLIVCPSCASEYTIDAAHLGPEGRTVRCAACRGTFFVTPAPEEAQTAAEDDDWLSSDWAESEAAPETAISAEARTGRGPKPIPAAKKAGGSRRRLPTRLVAPPRASARAAACLLCLGLVSGAVLGRSHVVNLAPETARLYAAIGLPVNLRGFAIQAVTSEIVTAGDGATLVVEGEIENVRGATAAVPRIEVSVRAADDQALYTWTIEPPRTTLPAQESARFRARLAAPPSDARHVLVRFAAPSEGVPVAANPR